VHAVSIAMFPSDDVRAWLDALPTRLLVASFDDPLRSAREVVSQTSSWRPTFINRAARAWIGMRENEPAAALLQRVHEADRQLPMCLAQAAAASTEWRCCVRIQLAYQTASDDTSTVQFDVAPAPGDSSGSFVCTLELAPSAVSPPSARQTTNDSRMSDEVSYPSSISHTRGNSRRLSSSPPNAVASSNSPTPRRRSISDSADTTPTATAISPATLNTALAPLVLPDPVNRILLDEYFSRLPVMMCVLLGGRFVRVSSAFEHVLGWSEAELLTMSTAHIFHPDDLPHISVENVRTIMETNAQVQAARSPSADAHPYNARDGEHKAQAVDTDVINRLRHKRPGVGFISCMTHMALSATLMPQQQQQQQQQQQPSNRSNGTLPSASSDQSWSRESSVSFAAPALEPFIFLQLRPMYKQEREALSAALDGIAQQKQQLVSNITHEMQTPMNGIVASAEMLGGTELTGEQTDYLNCIQISAEHMATIIGDIVSFASIDKGALQLEHKSMHINAVVEEAVALCFRPRLHDQLEIMHVLAPDLPALILGDVARVRQVLIHQLSNALKVRQTISTRDDKPVLPL
jgi:PAS domain S-box-containing protein